MQLSVGVLIIGSLYWDEDGGRDRWRDERLQRDREWLVKAPIRYGRLSEKSATCTMVFSELSEDQLGQARVVQCRNTITSLADLITEAEWLWSAESKRALERRISSSWGCVALLSNPEKKVPQDLLDGWAQHVAASYEEDAGRLVNRRGILQILWPKITDGSGIIPLHLLLTASNSPTLPYPNVEAIATGWRTGNDEYFRQNRNNRIQTFQDDAIADLLLFS